MDLYPPLGMPRPIYCQLCGGRVPGDVCDRHDATSEQRAAFTDKRIPLHFVRHIGAPNV